MSSHHDLASTHNAQGTQGTQGTEDPRDTQGHPAGEPTQVAAPLPGSHDDFMTVAKWPMIFALVLGILTVVGVFAGSYLVYQKAAHAPVPVSLIDAPQAESAECSAFINSLPDSLSGYQQVGIVDPAPAGVAAFARNSEDRIIVRCGIHYPEQFTRFSEVSTTGESQWFSVADVTEPNNPRETWYTVSTSPVIAITAQAGAFKPAELTAAVAALPHIAPEPQPTLIDVLAPGSVAGCTEFNEALKSLGTVPTNAGDYTVADQVDVNGTVAFTLEGAEPALIRCGVEPLPGYAPGTQLIQVTDLTWFNDTTLGGGFTTGVYAPMNFGTTVAMQLPTTVAANFMTDLAPLLTKALPKN